ncbi:MAG: DMT family transporter [Flavobacteriaceae bacterium]|nr:DMT family transporter [Flavobacteriaceae bacterium]
MNNRQLRWFILIILSLIWGSSFILIKKALIGFTPFQVGAFRILITATFLLIIGFRSILKIERYQWKYILMTALLGSFFPAFMYAFAITGIDSSVASILNSLLPLFTIIIGALIFEFTFVKNQLYGIIIGFVGTGLLIFKGSELNPDQNYWYALLAITSTLGYAFNVNIIKKHLNDLDALSITTGNFLLLIIPALIVLIFTGFFTTFELNDKTTESFGYVLILAIAGTAFAKVFFNKLIQISSPVFSSSVTYLIPIVAIMWGIADGEKFETVQFIAASIILGGVYIANKKG